MSVNSPTVEYDMQELIDAFVPPPWWQAEVDACAVALAHSIDAKIMADYMAADEAGQDGK